MLEPSDARAYGLLGGPGSRRLSLTYPPRKRWVSDARAYEGLLRGPGQARLVRSISNIPTS